MTKREVVDRIAALDAEIAVRDEERRMLRELLAEWPDGADTLHALDSEPPDTLPGSPDGRTRSSQRRLAVTIPPRDDE